MTTRRSFIGLWRDIWFEFRHAYFRKHPTPVRVNQFRHAVRVGRYTTSCGGAFVVGDNVIKGRGFGNEGDT